MRTFCILFSCLILAILRVFSRVYSSWDKKHLKCRRHAWSVAMCHSPHMDTNPITLPPLSTQQALDITVLGFPAWPPFHPFCSRVTSRTVATILSPHDSK